MRKGCDEGVEEGENGENSCPLSSLLINHLNGNKLQWRLLVTKFKCIYIHQSNHSDVTLQFVNVLLSNSSLNCQPNSTLSWTEKELTLFSHVTMSPRRPLHISPATVAHLPGNLRTFPGNPTPHLNCCQTPDLGLGLGVDNSFAWDNNNNNKKQ